MKTFPILIDYKIRNYDGIRTVPWDFIEPARKQIEANHGQTLERLAERGGLCWYEILCGLQKQKLFKNNIDKTLCEHKVNEMLITWYVQNKIDIT